MFQRDPDCGAGADEVPSPPPAGRVNIGALLRTAREGRARSLATCARALRMQVADLKAIEDNAFDALPGGGVTVSWLRRYARLLDMDPDVVVATYRAQHRAEAHSFRSDRTVVLARQSRRSKRRPLLMAGFCVVILLVLGMIALAVVPDAVVQMALARTGL